MFKRLGIGARLLIAFLGISALSLSSGVAGWLVLRDISQAQHAMNTVALPAVAATQRTADASARLVAAAPALYAARDEAARSKQDAEIQALIADIRRSAADARFASFGNDAVAELSQTVDLLVLNLAAQNRLVKERLELQQRFAARAEQTLAAATAIVDLSETLVSNASAGASAVISNLYELIDDPARRDQSFDALDRLTEQDIDLLDRMSELRLRSSQIGLLVNRLTRAADRADVIDVARSYHEHLRVVRRRVASIDDPVRQAQAAGYLDTLQRSVETSPWDASLFGQRLRLIDIADTLDTGAADNRALSAAMSRVAGAMLAGSEGFALATARQAESAVGTGLYFLVISSLIAVASSVLIVWLYVERSVVRRLASLAGAMERLTAGDLTVAAADEGAPELRAMSRAVNAFREESTQRRALEVEREKTNEELRRHREELRELVEERTKQLQDANALLQQEVTQHAAAREKAESASRAKSDFLAAMSHEIRTPMTGMLGMIRILQNSDVGPDQRKQLALAATSGEALHGILNSILDYSKIESGKERADPAPFGLRDALGGVTELMRSAAAEKGLALAFEWDTRLWTRHVTDEGKLRQIVFNLLSNAIKFTESGRIVIAARKTGGDRDRQLVAIAVTDTGIGIAAADRDRVFQSFTQSDASTTRRYGGTGLGLAISRRLAELLGGTLSVDSRPGAGSTFTLALPLARAPAQRRQPAARRAPNGAPQKPLHVLIVEDDVATQMVARSFIESMGHEATVAPDGSAALASARRRLPQLVLMDISLPDVDGVETARRLRALDGAAALPIVAMSAHVFTEEVDRYLAGGMTDFVSKPLKPESLAAAIGRACRGAAEPAAVPRAPDRSSLRADVAALGPATVQRILAIAAEALPKRFAAMRAHIEDGAFGDVAFLAHAVRSSAAAAGFGALLASAERLEQCARVEDAAGAARLLRRCLADFRREMAAAKALVAEIELPAQETVAAKR